MSAFAIDPLLFFEGEELQRAHSSFRKYQSYTGAAFDRWVATTEPNRITPLDILAVSTLSVAVPPEVAIWVLDDGAKEISNLLTGIPVDATIWDTADHVGSDNKAEQLYWLIKAKHGMGRTTTSKLLAAKRPALIPIWDDRVGNALASPDVNYWQLWHERCASPQGDELKLAASVVREATAPHVQLLRVIDIVVWMRVWGDKELAAKPGPGSRRPFVSK